MHGAPLEYLKWYYNTNVWKDTIVNGHPVRPDFGPGPLEAIDAYVAANPGRLVPDLKRESKCGCTFAYRGYHKVN